jgi:hypothetical protein
VVLSGRHTAGVWSWQMYCVLPAAQSDRSRVPTMQCANYKQHSGSSYQHACHSKVKCTLSVEWHVGLSALLLCGASVCDSYKTARVRQVHQGVVESLRKLMIPEWNNWASFYVVITVIYIKYVIGNLTSWIFFIVRSSIFMYCWNLFFCIVVCVALCVGCCITLRVLQVHSITVVCTVKKISLSETKFYVCERGII